METHSILSLTEGFEDTESFLILKAFLFAEKMHRGQKRYDGTPYIVHPVAVARILVLELGIRDAELVCTSLLHDVLEDTPTTREDLERVFGKIITSLVEGVTKPEYLLPEEETTIPLVQKKHEARERYALQLAEHPDPRVLLLKLCDALDNMRTLHCCEQTKRLRTQEKTRRYYLPLLNVLEREHTHLQEETNHLKRELFFALGIR